MRRRRDAVPDPRLIGTTDLAAVLGLSPWVTAYELWKRLLAGAWPEFEVEQRRRMQTGLVRQEQVAGWWSEDHQRRIAPGPCVVRPRGQPWRRASTDYVVVGADEALEIKLTERFDSGEWGEAGTDRIPDHYAIQVQAQLEAFGWRRMHVALAWGLANSRYYVVDAVPDIGAALVEAGARFWRDYVETERPPPLTEIERNRQRWADLRAKFGAPGDVEREATPEEARLATEIAQARARARASQEAIEPLELQLRESLGDVGRAWWGHPKTGSRIVCRPRKAPEVIDWRTVASTAGASAELIAQHTRQGTPTRPLLITLKEEEPQP